MSVIKSNPTVMTLLGQTNLMSSFSKASFPIMPSTTINTKRVNLGDVIPTNGEKPVIQYVGIGVNGFYHEDDGWKSRPYFPSPENMDLYYPIPFRVVPLQADLTGSEQAQYRMRTIIQDNEGESWVAYWLKKIVYGQDVSVDVKKVFPDGTEADYDFTAHAADFLHPTPSKTYSPDLSNENNTIVKVSVTGTCTISNAEVMEAVNILYNGDLNYAKISEFGLYSGLDLPNVTTESGATYTESIYTQLAVHRCTNGNDISDPDAEIAEEIKFHSGALTILP